MEEKITPHMVSSKDTFADSEYIEWVHEIKQRYRNSQIKAAVKVNSEQLLFNWQLGRDLVIRKAEEKWGTGIVEQLSLDLQAEFPGAKGFSARNLWFMKQWYTFYSTNSNATVLISNMETQFVGTDSKLNQLGSEIHEQKLNQTGSEMIFPSVFAYVPWKHHILIVQKSKSIDEALFYIQKTIEGSLSRNALDDVIRADLYHSSGNALTNFTEQLPMVQGKLAQEILKSNYDLGFVSLPEGYDEDALEDILEQRMTRFLLELGDGWAFVGRQKEIIVSGKTRKIDLLFYHIYLRCYVVLELKVKPFDPEFAGKLNFYVNAVNEYVKRDSDNPTIGLLICKDMDRTEVQLAFQGITTPMGVATYDNVKIKEITDHLPTAEQIQQQIELAEKEYRMNITKA
ncbi:MAG: PDDEXK nuclease domain-containing protein [Lachnospiraceae bacterium]|nr:PDDEXK nuclease domain-containing protein [Lachnospiraceae bacterium]